MLGVTLTGFGQWKRLQEQRIDAAGPRVRASVSVISVGILRTYATKSLANHPELYMGSETSPQIRKVDRIGKDARE